MTSSFSEDPKDEPIEVDLREKDPEDEDVDTAEQIAADKDEPEDADEAEIKAAAPKEITLDDVADVHYDKKGNEDGFVLSVTKAAHALAKKMRIVMCAESDKIYRFDGEIYKPDGSRLADMKLCSLLGDEITIVKFKEVERRIKNTLLSSLIEFEPDPYLLAVKNGVVDLRTGAFRGFRPEDLLLEKLDITYDKNARCPVFCGFMYTATNVIVDRLSLIDWFACHAIKLPIPYVLFLLGLGRNGKGIYEKLLKEFYGQCSFRDFAIDAPEKNNFAASALYRKRGWVAAESKKSKKEPTLGTEFMKLASGNGVIDADVKNKERVMFEPYFQITVDSNSMPRITDRSIGWEERLVKINLPYLFLAALVEGDPQVKVADPDLFKKLTTPSELSGILNLIIDRSITICKTKRITKREGKEMVKEYSEQSSSITTFLTEFCEYDSDLSGLLQPFAEVFEAFETWCTLTVSEKVDEGYFGKQLKLLCGNIPPKRSKTAAPERKNITHYRGLIFDKSKYNTVIGKLQAGFKEENVSSVSGMSQDKSQENSTLLISNSQVSLVNRWNDIVKRYGDISYIAKENTNLHDTDETHETPISGDPFLNPKPCLADIPENEIPRDNPNPSVRSMVVGSTSLEGARVEDPEITRLRAGHKQHATRQQKRTCHICGYESDHDLTQDMSRREYVNCYLCPTCHITHRVKSTVQAEVPAAPNPQTSLSDVV